MFSISIPFPKIAQEAPVFLLLFLFYFIHLFFFCVCMGGGGGGGFRRGVIALILNNGQSIFISVLM